MRIPSATLALPLLLALAGCGGGGTAARTFPGTIELDESDAAPLVGGRVLTVRVTEGDTVRVGDTLAVLTQSQIPANLEDRRARLAAAESRLADLRRGSRPAEITRAEAELAALEADADRTARDLARATQLARDTVISRQDLDRATSAAEAAARRRDAARATLDVLREGSRADQVRTAESEVASARAQLSGARADVGELAVLAAVDGVILGRHTEPGEVVAAGTPLVTIGVVARRWVRVYLPADLIASLPAGAPATIRLPAATGTQQWTGTLGAINPRAEFTPRAALTEQERADLLFAARVALHDSTGLLRPGLPVTVQF
ncbi:MAG: HlyD family efflux transporter periplasmic adaptor subunit [Gemmatimonadota bacterium]|nr:HlyD family efflux transporter periplasmic adaptor subunit [Gemmatimonadota bacterium]